MGKIVMPKNSALLNEIEAVLKIYYEANDWISNDEYKQKLKALIGDDQYASSYTKKAQITSYFGFTEWETTSPQSKRRITESGRKMYEAITKGDTEMVQEVLMNSLENVKFGRDNFGCPDSNTDVEPPTLFVRAILDLGYLTYKEFAFLLWKLEDIGANYTDTLEELRQMRNDGPIVLNEEAVKYSDCKPIMILVRWGFLTEEPGEYAGGKHIIIVPEVMAKYKSRLKNLKIYNIDMDVEDSKDLPEKEVIAEKITNMSLDELGEKLSQMYNTAEVKTTAIHMFGVKYAPIILQNNYSYKDICVAAGLGDTGYDVEIGKGIRVYRSILQNEYGIRFYEKPRITEPVAKWLKDKKHNGYNKIFYGAPGCGKSRHVKDLLKAANVSEKNIIRVTFHPEYMNCDFVGQVLPTIEERINPDTGKKEEDVKYVFNPGPFTRALERAYQTTDMVYLIIEEINRGNAAAIFGDLFQLLDREKDRSSANYGDSDYPIYNTGIMDYFVRINDVDILIETVKNGIFIPSNLTILATMNSSDQNVFTLDTAFKRRWLFEQISNDITKDNKHKYKTWYVPGTDVTWEIFLTKINDEILNYKIQNQTNEDKRLGKYFVTDECLTKEIENSSNVRETAERFAYKVLDYVWSDVCKIGRDDWFDTTKYKTLEDLIEAFVNPQNGNSPLEIFRNIDFKA